MFPVMNARPGMAMLMAFAAIAAPCMAASFPDAAKVYSEEEAWQIGWPMLNGPLGNFLALRTGVKIVDDLAQARIAWRSEVRDFGSAKTGSQSFRTARDITARLGPDARVTPGNWAGVIVAEGKVFGSSWRPVGPICEATIDGETARFRLDAEDLLIALDARTGKLLWRAAEPGGLVLTGGKRGGFQVAPAYSAGKVFSMGSTGRLFAYDAASGRKLWQTDIGPAHAAAAKRREQVLAAAAAGKWTSTDAAGWHVSLTVAEGMLIVPTFTSPRGVFGDTNLRGVDVETGQTKWEFPAAVSRWATPSVWRHGDREYLLCATIGGVLRLIDPRDGRELWKVDGLGPHYSTLSPSPSHVLVNVAAKADPKEKRVPGYLGAFRISPTKAELAWKMPQEPRNQISTWFDNCALLRYLMRDGMVYVAPNGAKDEDEDGPERGHFLLLNEQTGEVLARHVNKGDEVDQIRGLFYLVEDRLLCRVNSNHGPTHGGRHPFVQWNVAPGKIARMDHEGRLSPMDLAEFATAYEVYMELPVVAGRMFERTLDGGVVCYDLRREEQLATWSLNLHGGYVGLPELPMRIWTRADGSVAGAKALPPDSRQAGLPWNQCRRFACWEKATPVDAAVRGERLEGTIDIYFGTHGWPTQLDLKRSGNEVSGTWTRRIEPLAQVVTTEGAVEGRGPVPQRIFPWAGRSADARSWQSYGDNPPGVSSWAIELADAITLGRRPARLVVCIDHDGKQVLRAVAAAYGFSQAWHEVDAGGLRISPERITGTMTVVLNADWWTSPRPDGKRGVAGRIDLDVTSRDGALSGKYKASFGVPWTTSGRVTGMFAAAQ